ncbi:MAG: EVE domain-containing protein [SAR202 cluster bacterium]|nr:EVE domain-containing protein [SAR202 cluster bacterium]
MPRWWLAVGAPGNWESTFKLGNIWGTKAKGRPAIMWESIAQGDRLVFYVGIPVSGIVGLGTVTTKFKQDKPLWPDEVKEKKVLWPLRFEFDVDYLMPPANWKAQKYSSERIRTLSRGGFQSLDEESIAEISAAFEEHAGLRPDESEMTPLHSQLISKLLQIGSLQKFITEKEYSMNGARLDVVWRRVERSVPTYVFEVQVGGDLYRALAKLKHAYDLWNSRIFLVANPKDFTKAGELLSGTFHEIRDQLRFIDIKKVEKLFELKQQIKSLESEIGIALFLFFKTPDASSGLMLTIEKVHLSF